MTWITPFHRDSDFRWPLCPDDKVLIFEERICWATWPCSTADRWRFSTRRAALAASSSRPPTWPMPCATAARRSAAAFTRRWSGRAWRFC